MKLDITPAEVLKAKSRLKAIGLYNKKDDLIFGVFIQAIESQNVQSLTKEMLIEISFLIQFANSVGDSIASKKYNIDGVSKMKYKNNKRINLD